MFVRSLVYDKIPLSNHFRDKPVCLSVVDGLSADLDTQLLSSGWIPEVTALEYLFNDSASLFFYHVRFQVQSLQYLEFYSYMVFLSQSSL